MKPPHPQPPDPVCLHHHHPHLDAIPRSGWLECLLRAIHLQNQGAASQKRDKSTSNHLAGAKSKIGAGYMHQKLKHKIDQESTNEIRPSKSRQNPKTDDKGVNPADAKTGNNKQAKPAEAKNRRLVMDRLVMDQLVMDLTNLVQNRELD